MNRSNATPAELWYRSPAEGFLQALPLGNGSLGAMVYGRTGEEVINLNADTLWSGGPADHNDEGAAAHLDELRRAVLRDRDYVRAEELARRMQGPFTQAYQPLGDLRLDFGRHAAVTDYRRGLDLRDGVCAVAYTADGVRHTREVFCSAVAGVLVIRLSCDTPGALNVTAALRTPHPSKPADDEQTHALMGRAPSHVEFDGTGPDAVRYDPEAGTGFAVALRVVTDSGEVTRGPGGELTLAGATSAVLLVAAATGYRGWNEPPLGPGPARESAERILAEASAVPYERLLTEHTADHRRLHDRAVLWLDHDPRLADLPTDERVAAVRDGADDPGLTALHFAYGRYLLMASSRPGTQPANLQGIWNTEIQPPWQSNWTTNINLPMNYWPAETTGLPECHQPLLDLLADLSVAGRRSAWAYYRCGGWTAHHNVDIWRSSNPVQGEPQWANWPMGAAWLCAHLWQHYRFGRDRAYLADQAWPVMREAAVFLLDFLTEDADGNLVTCPSTSPEHRFRAADGSLVATTAAATMDLWLVDELFANCLSALDELELHDDLRTCLSEARRRLRPLPHQPGQPLAEWWDDAVPEDLGHRHLSHLYGLYPGEKVDPGTSPVLAAAARAALELRLAHGGGGTGWSLAWVAALAARLGDGDLAHGTLRTLLVNSTADNLFGLHPHLEDPTIPPVFQLDANFGASGALAETLVQSHTGEIRLLPALPSAWPSGRVQGLRARNGVTVQSLDWSEGHLSEACLELPVAGEYTVQAPTAGLALSVDAEDAPAPSLTSGPVGRGTTRVTFTVARPCAVRLRTGS
ncbi:glycoside hydrolase family 95 protein [Streptomyces gilvus]|uniref:glycoside hydrolase family 95 protein n=1 Tax=Streptomyces gilvus TaxID=2920937 RepID=UPI001F0F7CFD|nr:glycoside hydrolase family 95 protein [Streptomyces sp. CME 23]MCH5676617.1 glycoside hydrolase family 95 protein [Streptomyces sp. CME 23]